jgi:hypothetical protein
MGVGNNDAGAGRDGELEQVQRVSGLVTGHEKRNTHSAQADGFNHAWPSEGLRAIILRNSGKSMLKMKAFSTLDFSAFFHISVYH